MAGTKKKPCRTCKWDNFEIWMACNPDKCFACHAGSHHELNILLARNDE